MSKKFKKSTGVIITLVIASIIGAVFVFNKLFSEPKLTEPPMTLYWGNTCTHCHALMQGKVYKELNRRYQLTLKEIFLNVNNNLELTQAAANCGIPSAQVGVPMLYLSEQQLCFIGPVEIEEFFATLLAGDDFISDSSSTDSANATTSSEIDLKIQVD